MKRLGDFVVRFRILVLVAGLVGFVLAGAFGGGVSESLSNGGFADPGAESVRAADLLESQFGVTDPAIVLIATAPGGSVDDPAAVEAGLALTAELGVEAGVSSASSYWSLGEAAPLRSESGDRALVFATVAGDQGEMLTRSGELAAAYRGDHGGLDIAVAGQGPLFAEVQDTIETDLVRAETIAFPITAVLLVLIFGSLVAASLPLFIGGFAIVGTFLVLQILTGFTEVSIFALNLTTALGLGLAIDYSLFVVSRYREELAAGYEPKEAVSRTVQTAGRTVLFSAGTVAASLASMLVFNLAFLRSFGYAGIAVVALAALGAVVVLPSILALLGHRVDRLKVRNVRPAGTGTGIWHRIATGVMRRPWPVATGAVLLLAVLGTPFFGVQLGRSDDRVLPATTAVREAGDILRADFNSFEASPINVVAGADAGSNAAAVAEYAATLSTLDGVSHVEAATGTYAGGVEVAAAGPANARFASAGGGTYLAVIPTVEPISPEGEALVNTIRNLDVPFDVLVTGGSADLVDTKASLFRSLPFAIGIIGVVTFVLLFLMFGSVVVPAKAVVLNMLSLSATFGALVWIFQDGHLANLLGFTATGTLEITMPILMFAIAFGLSMDYEVFLLSRIKEEHDGGRSNVDSVAIGLERTGRIVTAAAVLIAVVFIAFATSNVSFMKMFGVGMTVAVLVDAFVVRATLVPAFMRLAGDANWWAPGWMQAIYRRFGIREHAVLRDDAPPIIDLAPQEV
jgi:RND superfamily putative drug exporter